MRRGPETNDVRAMRYRPVVTIRGPVVQGDVDGHGGD